MISTEKTSFLAFLDSGAVLGNTTFLTPFCEVGSGGEMREMRGGSRKEMGQMGPSPETSAEAKSLLDSCG